jgi:thioesterase domain-containing protein
MTATVSVLPLHQSRPQDCPFFVVPGLGAHLLSTQVLAARVPEPWCGFGVSYPSFLLSESPDRTFAAMAGRMVDSIRRVRPEGPYRLVGYSMGGLLAVEMARHLLEAGAEVGLVLVDVKLFEHAPLKPVYERLPLKAYWMTRDWVSRHGKDGKAAERTAMQRRISHVPDATQGLPESFAKAIREGRSALDAYRLESVNASSVVIRCSELAWWDSLRNWPSDYGWGRYTDVLAVLTSPGDHLTMTRGPNLEHIGYAIGKSLDILAQRASLPPARNVR